ncbi:MAG: hypothetical protein DWQ04_00840, partial [Chloroflexi bacterium]
MISEETVWNDVWPVAEKVIEATLAENGDGIAELVAPGGQAAEMLDLFGFAVFDVLLKTVLGRGSLGITQAVETENGRFIHIEYAWPEPGADPNSFTATDLVAVTFTNLDKQWCIVEVNPSSIDMPLTEPRARGMLASTQTLSEHDKVPAEPWILPFALYGGMLQIPILEAAMADEVESKFLHGLQERNYGVMTILRGRKMWRDFVTAVSPTLDKPSGWAAALEFIMSEQNKRNQTQAAISKHYKVNLSTMVPRI